MQHMQRQFSLTPLTSTTHTHTHTHTFKVLVSDNYRHCYDRLGETTDSVGNTPLHTAAMKGHLDSVKVCRKKILYYAIFP